MKKKLLIVQYAGDFKDAYHRLKDDGAESYYGQKYSIDSVVEQCQRFDEVITVTCFSDGEYDDVLECGVRAIGVGFTREQGYKDNVRALMRVLNSIKSTHTLIRTPIPDLIRWAIKTDQVIAMTLADSFENNTFKKRIKNFLLQRLLNHKKILWVGNHGVGACESLKSIGVDAKRIVPWDWPHVNSPERYPHKQLLTNRQNGVFVAVYVGVISEAKGVWEAIDAVARLNKSGVHLTLKIAGKGDVEAAKAYAAKVNAEANIEFLGLIPNTEVIVQMRHADVVLVPSRKTYPEGFPLTIYEALCSRTPIVASNHPMFGRCLVHEQTCLVFESGSSEALAESIRRLLSDSELYERLSIASKPAWESLQLPVTWGAFLTAAFASDPAERALLANNSLG